MSKSSFNQHCTNCALKLTVASQLFEYIAVTNEKDKGVKIKVMDAINEVYGFSARYLAVAHLEIENDADETTFNELCEATEKITKGGLFLCRKCASIFEQVYNYQIQFKRLANEVSLLSKAIKRYSPTEIKIEFVPESDIDLLNDIKTEDEEINTEITEDEEINTEITEDEEMNTEISEDEEITTEITEDPMEASHSPAFHESSEENDDDYSEEDEDVKFDIDSLPSDTEEIQSTPSSLTSTTTVLETKCNESSRGSRRKQSLITTAYATQRSETQPKQSDDRTNAEKEKPIFLVPKCQMKTLTATNLNKNKVVFMPLPKQAAISTQESLTNQTTSKPAILKRTLTGNLLGIPDGPTLEAKLTAARALNCPKTRTLSLESRLELRELEAKIRKSAPESFPKAKVCYTRRERHYINGQYVDVPRNPNKDKEKSEKLFTCVCHKSFRNLEALRKHENGFLWKKPVSCELCNAQFSKSYLLYIHKKEDHNIVHPASLKCDLCDETFLSATNKKTHMLGHMSSRSFICEKCGNGFRCDAHLKRHIKTVHGDEGCDKERFKCQECGLSLKHSNSLKNHMQTMHSKNPKTFICPQCGKITKNMTNMNIHMQVHDPNRVLKSKSSTTKTRKTRKAPVVNENDDK